MSHAEQHHFENTKFPPSQTLTQINAAAIVTSTQMNNPSQHRFNPSTSTSHPQFQSHSATPYQFTTTLGSSTQIEPTTNRKQHIPMQQEYTQSASRPSHLESSPNAYSLLSQQLIEQSNIKPTLVNHLLQFEEDGSLDKANFQYLNQQLHSINSQNRTQLLSQNQPIIPTNPFIQMQPTQPPPSQNIEAPKYINNNNNSNSGYQSQDQLFLSLEENPQSSQWIPRQLSLQDNSLGDEDEDLVEDEDQNEQDEFNMNQDQINNPNEQLNNTDEDDEIEGEGDADANGNHLNSDKTYICEYTDCQKVFKAKKSLRDHLRIHTNQRPYVCFEPNCGKSFVQYSSLQKHQRTHRGDRPYKCDFFECDQAFTQVSNLKRHQKIHVNDKPYECSLCRRRFTTSSNLRQHQITHENQVKYNFQIIHKNVTIPLTCHHVMHSLQGERMRFQCAIDECGKSYLYQSSLKKHEKEHILNNKISSAPASAHLSKSLSIPSSTQPNGGATSQHEEGCELNPSLYNEQSTQQRTMMKPKDEVSASELRHNQRVFGDDDNDEDDEEEDEQHNDHGNKASLFHSHTNEATSHSHNHAHSHSHNHSHSTSHNHPQSQNHSHANSSCSTNRGFMPPARKKQQVEEQQQQLSQLHVAPSQQTRVNLEDMDMLGHFFTSSHVALQHDGHYDVLFKGYLYHYNKKTGKIEIHDIQASDERKKGTCQPLSETSHAENSSSTETCSQQSHPQNQNQQQSGGATTPACCASTESDNQSFSQQNQGSNNIVGVVCCNEPNCDKEDIIAPQESNNRINSKPSETNDVQSCCGPQQHQQPVAQEEQNSGNEAGVKAEDCCCTIDDVKIECICTPNGCGEGGDCQSCSDSLKCRYKISVQTKRQDGYQGQPVSTTIEIPQPSLQQRRILDDETIVSKLSKCFCTIGRGGLSTEQKDLKHLHGPNCGHVSIYHNGHLDYIVENQLHHPHGSHCDFHGTVNVLDNIVKI